MPALATHTVQTAAPAGRLPPLRPSFAWQCLARAGLPSTARQQPRRLLAANASGAGPQQPPGGDGEDKEAPERLRFPAAAAAIRRQQIQQQRSEIWGRIGELVSYDSDEEDSALVDLVGDEFKEADRKNLRTVFDFERWKKHRSGSRYIRHARYTFTSRIVQGLAAPMLYVTILAASVATWHAAAEMGIAAPIPNIKIDSTFSLTSFALSLLLAYRTSASYGRWDEARKMWGLVVNRSRDFTRQGLAYIPDSQGGLQAGLVRWTIAYSRCLMCHLRDGEDVGRELVGILTPKELAALQASAHRPNYVVQVLALILREAKLPGWTVDNTNSFANVKASAFVRMDEQLTVFSDVTGGCERILRTPIPLSYTRHTSRFLVIWLTLMPFTLWETCRWTMVPLSAVVAFLLLGIEEIGVLIEEPFSVLPLEVISRTIETNVRELEKQHGIQAGAARELAAAAASDGTSVPGALTARLRGGNGEVDAEELVHSIVPAAELQGAWGPEWEVLSGTAGPAAVPASK